MKKIILDTNFLLIPFQFKVDIFSEIERLCSFTHKIAMFDTAVGELEKIAREQKGRDKLAASIALQLVRHKCIEIIKSKAGLSVDDMTVEYAGKDTIVATQDSGLKKRLREKGVGIISLRGKSSLSMFGCHGD